MVTFTDITYHIVSMHIYKWYNWTLNTIHICTISTFMGSYSGDGFFSYLVWNLWNILQIWFMVRFEPNSRTRCLPTFTFQVEISHFLETINHVKDLTNSFMVWYIFKCISIWSIAKCIFMFYFKISFWFRIYALEPALLRYHKPLLVWSTI